MAVSPHSLRLHRPRHTTLFRRLLVAYGGVIALGTAALIFAPVSLSVPRATVAEAAVIVAGGLAMLALYFALLRRALGPLERLTAVMREVDPLAPGRRIVVAGADEEVTALARAFNEMLQRLETERRDSARRALAAQEDERRRIAAELHDGIGQTFTGLLLCTDAIARRSPDALREDLEELREISRRGAEDVRRIARRLRPEALDQLGLASALTGLAAGVAEPAGLIVEQMLDPDVSLDPDAELVVFRVAQESLTNIVRHAGARRVRLSLSRRGSAAALTVSDDGGGLPSGVDGSRGGIRGMRERALLVGGTLTVAGAEPHGTTIELVVPTATPG